MYGDRHCICIAVTVGVRDGESDGVLAWCVESKITDRRIYPGSALTVYAAGYSDTWRYLGLVRVSWSISNLEGGSASISTYGISCTFTAGLEHGYDDGYAVWNAMHNGIYHNIGFHIVDDG